jgi:hypothetical protein
MRKVEEHLGHPDLGEAADAALAAIQAGNIEAAHTGYWFGIVYGIDIGDRAWAEDAMQNRKRRASLIKGNKQRHQDRDKLDEAIDAAVAERVSKRGDKKQPSLTAIRKRVAKELNVSLSRIY